MKQEFAFSANTRRLPAEQAALNHLVVGSVPGVSMRMVGSSPAVRERSIVERESRRANRSS